MPPTEVEVTLLDLGPDIEQMLDDRLELIDPETGIPAIEARVGEAQLGIRIRYRLVYDQRIGDPEQSWDFPKTGNRVPRSERALIAASVISPGMTLQLRSGATFRQMVADLDADGLTDALGILGDEIADATARLAEVKGVQAGVRDVLSEGAAQLLGVSQTSPGLGFGYVVDDGSGEAILRRLQPTLILDSGVGALPLSMHGSSAAGVLGVTEAMASAKLARSVVLADDFGDDLDAGSAEYLAALLRRKSGQVWLSTRRPEVARAFEPTEVLRLTQSHGHRRNHRLRQTTDRKERTARRQLHLLLLPAMTTRVVALLEGPHDQESLTSVAERRLHDKGIAPPVAYGVRLAATGLGDGGKTQLPKLARLAADLGFHVRVVMDNDKPGEDADLIAELAELSEQVILLPERTAIERALVRGLPSSVVREVLEELKSVYGLTVNIEAIPEPALENEAAKLLKQKGGLHQQFVNALPSGVFPPLVVEILDALTAAPLVDGFMQLENPEEGS